MNTGLLHRIMVSIKEKIHGQVPVKQYCAINLQSDTIKLGSTAF